MSNLLLIPIFLPIIVGVIIFLIKKWVKEISLATSVICLIISAIVFFCGEINFTKILYDGINFSLRAYNFSSFLLLAISFFSILIILYSFKFVEGKEKLTKYYSYILLTLGASCGIALSNNLILLLVFWGFLGITLCLLIGLGEEAASALKKTFVIVGGSDVLMILGIALIWMLLKTFDMSAVKLSLDGPVQILAYLCLAAGAFAKAGAVPFHSWVPDAEEVAPVPAVAYLPATIDKLLGIYFLARISFDLFKVTPNSFVSILLLILGSITIIYAVLMAMAQHNLKKLLSYHSVSQVGYMIIGIGTGIPVAIAGGLFHMLNNAIYKCCLFLASGAAEKQTGTTELEKLGGLGTHMPITFTAALVSSLSISGIPPLNGFFSKWMIYQGIVELWNFGPLWIFWLVSAMFGSALTLASFMKLIHATFLGQGARIKSQGEVDWTQWLPMATLAALCVIFGIFAYEFPLPVFILPLVPKVFFIGAWSPGIGGLLLILGLIIGALIYWVSNIGAAREDKTFIGGETLKEESIKVSGVHFYDTIKNLPVLTKLYKAEEEKFFDIYDQGVRLILFLAKALRRLYSEVKQK